MQFHMTDIPFDRVDVAEVMVRCLQECDRSFNAALEKTENLMPERDWKLLRRGVGQIVGSDMFDLWRAIVRQHPQFEKACYGERNGGAGGNNGRT